MTTPQPTPVHPLEKTPSTGGTPGVAARQYLSFFLGGQEYATDILAVQEIKGWDTVTRVPYTPEYLLVVINHRGAIVPVLDLRMRFSLADAAFDAATVVIVVHVAGNRGERIVGIVVDAVSDVYSVTSENIQPPPEVMGSVDHMFVTGLANLDGRLLIILDMERLVLSSVSGGGKLAA